MPILVCPHSIRLSAGVTVLYIKAMGGKKTSNDIAGTSQFISNRDENTKLWSE